MSTRTLVAMVTGEAWPPARRVRDDGTWRIGTDAEVGWITAGTTPGLTITAAIPPVFDAYATVMLPASEDKQKKHEQAMLTLLREHSADQPWWLGYLDTGADDIVFPDAPMVNLYSGWRYVLVEAGPAQAAAWRRSGPWSFWKGVLPNLMFPADRSWLLSTLWDDVWSCLGGSAGLVRGFLGHPDLQTRQVVLGQDATPPGQVAL
ncbi:hypothetical protein ND748_02065 [Frankia sp. AiPs1]|uniref:hypothetical protein n=1 Tax=Frankia sp. AiPs1 TaxID=573493 RepID=UPI002044BEAE|nr:hypothetical protein [Frankia sp. AiPs1]MCM3920473.1 hypothetical protein [Frankia sp. AiPs1]